MLLIMQRRDSLSAALGFKAARAPLRYSQRQAGEVGTF